MDIPSKFERLAEIYERLRQAPPGATAEETLKQLTDIINFVEDLRTQIPYNPKPWRNDGRLYAPEEDNAHDVDGQPDITRYRSVRHETFIRSNGAIEVRTLNGNIEFSKPGSDGREVWQK